MTGMKTWNLFFSHIVQVFILLLNTHHFFLMYGREAVLPIQLQTGNADNDHTLVTITDIESEAQKYATQLDMTRIEAFVKVASNIQNAQTKQKFYFDRKHSQAEFQLGNHQSFTMTASIHKLNFN